MIHNILFLLFSSIAIISAIMVIASNNPIHSVVSLILTFVNAAGLLILLKIDFISMMFIVVYVGAVAVLFLFVVMMLNIKLNEISENLYRYAPIGALISLIFFLEIFIILYSHFVPFTNVQSSQSLTSLFIQNPSLWEMSLQDVDFLTEVLVNNSIVDSFESNNKNWFSLIHSTSNIQSLGQLIYTEYFYHYLMASLILLVSMIGAIVLTMNKKETAKKQLIFKQVGRSFEEAVGYIENSKRLN